ncbi:hypothetical protein [Heyndrickxia sporothermodurans]|uniref:DUF4355 domain-containing protein n=1 Tax=Heyndrickxia sporothermodurans TaxID=46224 RepID=A0AB37HBM0_9BACI|nr:hypothetical protein [Heyndrickxia sporothermodurans]MBL5769283.1 hypothetical protein [Heyndrickxia sporothermodurans]MBL5773061.1 hypothetical protein [Heyndrickxia sporothermodurans]MBL5776554.1 hypothetical protein [Heyndrickxia sporothermodurans]MBL5783658.1 hypothetical protein [Heyndrickxia sporothermodurans]MBL5787157.1 hypothetical protein [Heyndrickxia sporothermodurans]
MAEEISFTQEQLDEAISNAKNEWIKNELNPIIAERDDLLQFKPKELSDDEKAFQQKQQELFDKEVSLTLKENGLEQFADVIKVGDSEELKTVIDSLTGIVNQIKIDNGYVPNDHKQQNEYDVFASKKDTQGMIATKLSKLFG